MTIGENEIFVDQACCAVADLFPVSGINGHGQSTHGLGRPPKQVCLWIVADFFHAVLTLGQDQRFQVPASGRFVHRRSEIVNRSTRICCRLRRRKVGRAAKNEQD